MALCEGAGPPAWVVSVYLMLDELAASLVVSRPAGAPASGHLSTLATASHEEASLVDTRWDPMVLKLDLYHGLASPHRQLVAPEGATLAMLRRPREAVLRARAVVVGELDPVGPGDAPYREPFLRWRRRLWSTRHRPCPTRAAWSRTKRWSLFNRPGKDNNLRPLLLKLLHSGRLFVSHWTPLF